MGGLGGSLGGRAKELNVFFFFFKDTVCRGVFFFVVLRGFRMFEECFGGKGC